MDKKIVLKMTSSRDIEIYLENGSSIKIPRDNRSIKANDIYDLISYTRGDKYSVKCINENGLDESALKFFAELISDIVTSLNNLSDCGEDDYLL